MFETSNVHEQYEYRHTLYGVSMAKKKDVPSMTKKLLFQQVNSQCPFCGEHDVTTLEIHHIHPESEGGSDEQENLIVICGNCHNKITNGNITEGEVLRKKISLLSGNRLNPPSLKEHGANVINFHQSTNTGYIANSMTIKAPKKSIKTAPAIGTIAADRDRKNYIHHLIKQYNEFKKSDGTANFSYAVIYRAIEREFRVAWKDVPIERFQELADYLQERIDKTKLGRGRKSRQQKNFSTFQEFLESQNISIEQETKEHNNSETT